MNNLLFFMNRKPIWNKRPTWLNGQQSTMAHKQTSGIQIYAFNKASLSSNKIDYMVMILLFPYPLGLSFPCLKSCNKGYEICYFGANILR